MMSKLTLREFYYMEATGKYLPHEEIGKLVEKNIDKMFTIKRIKKEE